MARNVARMSSLPGESLASVADRRSTSSDLWNIVEALLWVLKMLSQAGSMLNCRTRSVS